MLPLFGTLRLFVLLRKETTLRHKVLRCCLQWRFRSESGETENNETICWSYIYLIDVLTSSHRYLDDIEGWTAERQWGSRKKRCILRDQCLMCMFMQFNFTTVHSINMWEFVYYRAPLYERRNVTLHDTYIYSTKLRHLDEHVDVLNPHQTLCSRQ